MKEKPLFERTPLIRLSAGVEVLLLIGGAFLLAEFTGPIFNNFFGDETAWGRALIATSVHLVNIGVIILLRIFINRPRWSLREFGINRDISFLDEARDASGILSVKLAITALVFGVAMLSFPDIVSELQRTLHADSLKELVPQVLLRAPLRNAFSEEVRYHVVGQGLFLDRGGVAMGLVAGIALFGTGHGLLRGLLLLPVTVITAAYYNQTRRIIPLFLAHWLLDVIGAFGLWFWSASWIWIFAYGAFCLLFVWLSRKHAIRILREARRGVITAWANRDELKDVWNLGGLAILLGGYHLLVWLFYQSPD